MSNAAKLLKNTALLSIGTLLPKITSFITLPILTAYLTKSEYGIYDLVTTLIFLILPVTTLRIETGIFRFLLDCRDDKNEATRLISTVFIFDIIIALITVTFMLFILPLNFISRTLVCIYFYMDNVYNLTKQIARGLSKNLLYSISSVINSIINLALIVFTVVMQGQGLNGILLSLSTALIIAELMLITMCKLYRYLNVREFSVGLLKKVINYSWPMIPNALSSWIINLSDRTVISVVIGIEASAVYAVATKIPQIFSVAQNTFMLAWQENASETVNDNDVIIYYSQIFDAVFRILTGIMTSLIAITPILFKVLIHGNYQDAYSQMPFLFGGMLFSALSSFLGGIYIAQMKTKNIGISTTLAAVANLIIDLCLIQKLNLYAASLSTLLSYAFLCLYRMLDIQKLLKIYFCWKRIMFYLFIICLMSIICYLNNIYFNIFNFFFGSVFAFGINRIMLKNFCKVIVRKIGDMKNEL